MKAYIISLILSIVTVKAVQHQGTIDLVLEALNEEQWSQQELPCLERTTFILNNAKNYTVWAMWIWNSMQHPVGIFYGAPFNLGHYDQCVEAPTKAVEITTQYCVADVKLTSKAHQWKTRTAMGDTESFLGVFMIFNRLRTKACVNFNHWVPSGRYFESIYTIARNHMNRDVSKVTWGVCLPAECKPGAAAKILKAIYTVNPLMPVEPSIEVNHCQVAGVKNEFTVGFYAFLTLVLVLVATTLFATFFGEVSNPNLTITPVLQCFCLQRNWTALTKKSTSDDITSMNILKVAFAIGAVTIHSVYFRVQGPIANVFYIDWITSVTDKDIFLKNFVKNFNLGLEVFFAMAGILLMKGLMTSSKHPLISLISRYFRLMGTFALVTFYVAVASIHMGDGPLWQKLAGREQKASLDNWPWSLLMINNFVNSENITQIVAWHIPCDYQLAVMGTIVFMLWKKNYRLGKIVTIVLFVLAVLTPAVVTYIKKLPGVVLFDDIGKIADLRTNEVYLETHIKSYHRAVAYLIGMGMGYIIVVYKPEKYRKCISLKLSLFMFVAFCAIVLKVVTAAQCKVDDHLGTAIKLSGEKIYISLTTCAWIIVVEYGSIPFLRAATKFYPITVLSRLTYGIYLTHTLFLQQHAFSRRYLQQMELLSEITYSIGVMFWTILTSVLLWLLVEAPLNNLVNYATRRCSSINGQENALAKSEESLFHTIVKAEIHQREKLKEI